MCTLEIRSDPNTEEQASSSSEGLGGDFAQQEGGRGGVGIPGGVRDGWVLVAGDGEDLGGWRRVGLGRRSEAVWPLEGDGGFSRSLESGPYRVCWAGPSFLLHVFFFAQNFLFLSSCFTL